MIRVNADEERVVPLQHGAQFRSDALGQKDRNTRADADKFHVRNRPQRGEQLVQFVIAEKQRIAAAQENVADFRVLTDIVQLIRKTRMEIVSARIADQPRTRAITAIGRAAVGDQEQHAVGIPMHQARHRRVRVFAARIGHFPRCRVGLLQPRDDLPTDGTMFIRRIDQVEKIGRDGERQLVIGQLRAGVFLRRQRGHQPRQLFEPGDAVLKLPVPVVPIRVGNIVPETTAGGDKALESAGGTAFVAAIFRGSFN